LEALEALWIWAKYGKLHTGELLLVTNEDGVTALHLAAERSQVELLE